MDSYYEVGVGPYDRTHEAEPSPMSLKNEVGLQKSLDEKDLSTDKKVGRKEKGSSKCRDTGEGKVGIQRTPNLISVLLYFV